MRKTLEVALTPPLHHAYVLEGAFADDIKEFLSELLGMPHIANPDFFVASFDSFGVDDAHALTMLAMRAALGEKKIFLIGARSMTREAQNALLKTFEDPRPNTHFFLVVPRIAGLIPTLRSRMNVVMLPKAAEAAAGETFMKLPVAKRLAHVQKLAKAEDRAGVESFLDNVEASLRTTPEHRAGLEALFLCRKYMNDRGASPKMLLEYLALSL